MCARECKMSYLIETHYLEHNGGTKFYETVLIREGGGPALCVKRWGALGVKQGGGQVQFEKGSEGVVLQAQSKILREKRNKGYSDVTTLRNYGVHQFNGKATDQFQLAAAVQSHYGAATAKAITDYFGTGAWSVADRAIVSEEPIPEEPAPAASENTDERWGSW